MRTSFVAAARALGRRTRRALFLFPIGLATLGLLDRKKGEEAFDLAIPVMVTGSCGPSSGPSTS